MWVSITGPVFGLRDGKNIYGSWNGPLCPSKTTGRKHGGCPWEVCLYQAQELCQSHWPMFHWLEFSHMAPCSCKESWEISVDSGEKGNEFWWTHAINKNEQLQCLSPETRLILRTWSSGLWKDSVWKGTAEHLWPRIHHSHVAARQLHLFQSAFRWSPRTWQGK